MPKILILRGLPASGKSTYSKELIEKEPNRWKRINKDLLREMLDCGQWNKRNETYIIKTRNQFIIHYLKDGFNVIVDDTNFAPEHEKQIRMIAEELKEVVEVKFFDVSVEECIERDSKRAKPVGRKVIEEMAKRYNVGRPKPPERRYMGEPPAILCDIDGTLALMDGRGPFEWDKVDTDKPNMPVVDLIRIMDIPVILFSGRDEICRGKTESWLTKNNIKYRDLFMRPQGDMRKDSIVKRELFDNHIDGKWDIKFVLDDRNQVVNMWRNELGLPCFQVAEGNF